MPQNSKKVLQGRDGIWAGGRKEHGICVMERSCPRGASDNKLMMPASVGSPFFSRIRCMESAEKDRCCSKETKKGVGEGGREGHGICVRGRSCTRGASDDKLMMPGFSAVTIFTNKMDGVCGKIAVAQGKQKGVKI
ncbi:hypothetical protein CEXT_165061 [Caerostris extrusa]|uniref:Uncharacterized protein n=1 Tax=Caerostris extrusa TaxID=172846 RepID=A0AAV4XDC6_CAEEX|nr:hypothetical protein CEXT_165061 [Caerostris extrusa]